MFFDHLAGQVMGEFEGQVNNPPAKLYVRHGQMFVIKFLNTDPSQCTYKISVLEGDDLKAGSQTVGTTFVETDKRLTATLTWRHDRQYALYRVSVSAPAPPAEQASADGVPRDASAQMVETWNTTAEETQSVMSRAFQETMAGVEDQLSALGQQIETLTAERETLRRELAASRVEAGRLQERIGELSIEKRALEEKVQELTAERDTLLARLKALEKPKVRLYSYTFPIWVETIGWEPAFTGGFAFSNLTNDRFYVATDSHDTPDIADDTTTVEKDPNEGDEFRPDVIALGSLTYHTPKLPSVDFGANLGFGLADQAEPRYYLGAHVKLGDYFTIAAGVAGGKVSALPTGQRLHESPIGGNNTLGNLEKRSDIGWYIAIAFSIGDRKQDFTAALQGAQQVKKTEAKPPGKATE